jgi:hypothetical protein
MHWFLIILLDHGAVSVPMDDMLSCIKARNSYTEESLMRVAFCVNSEGDYLEK